jgi:uncharacterized protein (TIGR00255 family)
MIRSMTGFGRGERTAGSLHIDVEIRSVNHRHAEVRVKVPSRLAVLEDALRQRLGAAVTRGRVDATINLAGTEETTPIEINHSLVAAYLRAAGEIAERHALKGAIGLESVLALPGAVSLRSGNGDLTAEQQKAVLAAFEAAIEELQEARAAEGNRLAADIVRRLKAILKHRDLITRRAKGLPGRYARRLTERVDEIRKGVQVDPIRLAQEVAILASRSDITEELVRLQGHVKQALDYMRRPSEPVGKKLDFLLQEMHREANTINSKTEDLQISRDTLAIKAEVEKVREQAQNIE